MASAFVMINCEMGSEEKVIEELKSFCCVKKIYGVFGEYDIVTRLECERMEELRQTIITEIRKIGNIKSTRTLMETVRQC